METQQSSDSLKNPAGAHEMLQAIIEVAVEDFHLGNVSQRTDAIHYFRSDQYRRHLRLLGLPANWLPESIHKSILTFNNEPTLSLFAVSSITA